MYLLDESDKDKIINYDVLFPSKNQNIVSSKFYELMNSKDLLNNFISFTMAFIWNNSPRNWGLAKGYSKEEVYVKDLAENIDTSDLYYMFKVAEEYGNLDELFKYLLKDTNVRELYFTTTYRDIYNFSQVFPYAELTFCQNNDYFPNIFSIDKAMNNRYNFCSEMSDADFLKNVIEKAKNNTDAITRLHLKPNIR